MKSISFIVPIYNAETTLEQCIYSIEELKDVEYEIILVNDGSTDSSETICKKIEAEFFNIVYQKQKNAGVSVARNTGIDLAKKDYIVFIDPDDYIDAKLFEQVLKNINEEDIYITNCYTFDDNFTEELEFYSSDYIVQDKNNLYNQLLDISYGQNSKNPVTGVGVPWGKFYKRKFINNHGLRFEAKLRRLQDNQFNLEAFYFAKNIIYKNTPYYFYRIDHIKTMSKVNKELIDFYGVLLQTRWDFMSEKHLLNEDNQILLEKDFYKRYFFGVQKSILADNSLSYSEKLKKIRKIKNSLPWNNIEKFKSDKLKKYLYSSPFLTYSILNLKKKLRKSK